MANKEQQIVSSEAVSIDGDITVAGGEENLDLTRQIVYNTRVLEQVLKTLKNIDKSLIKIRQ